MNAGYRTALPREKHSLGILEPLRRINDALPGLVAGILLFGLLVQVTGVWFVPDKAAYSIGLWYGTAIAVGMAVNMATMIYDSVMEETGKKTNYRVVAKSIFRYLTVVILFAILGYFNFGNLFTAFLGVLGLKFSAYFQPVLARTGLPLFVTQECMPSGEGNSGEQGCEGSGGTNPAEGMDS